MQIQYVIHTDFDF